MLTTVAAGSVFFPGLFMLSKKLSTGLVSSVQAIMASSTGYITASSCEDIIKDQYWLTSTDILFAMPYFVYEIYAMVMCYWYKLRVKDHKAEWCQIPGRGPDLRRKFLIVLQHVVMVTVCFPISVFWRQDLVLS
uniref:TLC domain-containing protein n=1 Tax=Hucho hucho TaxID=62062 RepID=A0A4W5L4C5_9TELE